MQQTLNAVKFCFSAKCYSGFVSGLSCFAASGSNIKEGRNSNNFAALPSYMNQMKKIIDFLLGVTHNVFKMKKHHVLNSLDHSCKVQIQIKVSRLSPLLCPFQLSLSAH